MLRVFAITAGVAAAYWAASHLIAVFFSAFGFLPAPTWPAASVALSAAVLAGRVAAPGIALGSVLANAVSLGAPIQVAMGVAVMNTAAPLLAAALIREMAGGKAPFSTVRYVLAFMLAGLVLHPALTAIGGVATLLAAGRVDPALADTVWMKWWLAHASGTMLLTPAILCWWTRPRLGLKGRQLAEAVLVSALTVILAAFTFSVQGDAAHDHFGMTFALFAPVAWVAVRFGARDVAGLLPVVAIVAAVGTVNGLGPFHPGDTANPMAALGTMLVSLSLTALLVAALADERRDLEATLLEQHAYANTLLDNAASLTVVLDSDGNLLRFNQPCRRLTGYSESEVRGRLFWERLIPADELPGVEAAFRSLQAGFSPIHHENHLITRDHGPRLIAWENTVVKDPDGRVRFIIGSGQDITEQRWVQDEMRKLAMIAARTSNAVIITDAEGRTEWVNEAFTRLSGYRPDEIIGNKPGTVLQGPDTDPVTVARIRERLRAGEDCQEELLNYAKDGRPYWIEIEIQPVRDSHGRVDRFIAIENDITERKRSDDAQRRLLQILEAARDIVASADERGRLSYMNAAGRAILGIGADEDVTALRIADTHPPEAGEMVLRDALPIARRQGFWEGENEFLTRHGKRVPVWQGFVAHKDSDG
ncbi:MAG: PAS domain S-box protein, partial [Pseudomonadota bacterium]